MIIASRCLLVAGVTAEQGLASGTAWKDPTVALFISTLAEPMLTIMCVSPNSGTSPAVQVLSWVVECVS